MEIKRPKLTHGIVNRVTTSLFSYQGWPTVARDEKGVLYAVASSFRISHICPFGKTAMYKSFDGGKTWTPPIVINDTYVDDRDAGIVYLGKGKMIVTWFCHPARSYAEGEWFEFIKMAAPDAARGAAVGLLEGYKYLPDKVQGGGSYIRISEDYGVTWSDTIRVPISSPHGPTLLRDGSIGYFGLECYGTDVLPAMAIAYYKSFDGGYTWEKTSLINSPDWLREGEYLDEPHMIELPDGRLLAAFRMEGPYPLTLGFVYSDDGGKSWGEIKRLENEWGSPPHLLLHSSGALICTCGHREKPYGEHAFISYDLGESWTKRYILDESPYHDLGYPSTVELDDGSLITVYYQKYGDDNTPSILYTHWEL